MSDIDREKNGALVRRGVKAAKIAKCAIFVVLMVVATYIQIPFPFVPLTFQTVVAVLAGLLLGAKWGAASIAVYVFMGLLGLPVFTGGGGFSYVLNLTFGYTIGFIAAAFVSGLIAGAGQSTLLRTLIAAICGFLVNYAVGIPYFAIIYHFYLHNSGVWQIVVTGNLIYMPKDLILCVLAAFLAKSVRKAIHPKI